MIVDRKATVDRKTQEDFIWRSASC